jgi:hypothetical protein
VPRELIASEGPLAELLGGRAPLTRIEIGQVPRRTAAGGPLWCVPHICCLHATANL